MLMMSQCDVQSPYTIRYVNISRVLKMTNNQLSLLHDIETDKKVC